ncbi:hypothetical protein F07S3_69310 [Bradyrhizobium diazoefficiens]|uniref:Transposase n=1 Tax=Bradyrhizobium diazoefficiens TaxID=1355477 RepID=A0A809Y4S1_9BRAD|nr:hypothetical protein F07S3_69310 [Bradyrhizobium diazoefficiens]BCA06160.1 hypothetical protein H12S4_70640 [Bradyrhizobium diazoefficiens]BCA14787.1 hypothetical protein BDHF08_66340 [Bradyrhizobium diazoefficiens]BCA23512.1 hypothetical protein BDHH15_67270 [Bradyrhizobium diazoefficiens]BCE32891.1 hypothetical protein XF2B_66600 [Bradyrhizobium diazoefficiens]
MGGFAYVAVILDAWSRRAVGSAISRSIDVPLTLAALNAAVEIANRHADACITPIAAWSASWVCLAVSVPSLPTRM